MGKHKMYMWAKRVSVRILSFVKRVLFFLFVQLLPHSRGAHRRISVHRGIRMRRAARARVSMVATRPSARASAAEERCYSMGCLYHSPCAEYPHGQTFATCGEQTAKRGRRNRRAVGRVGQPQGQGMGGYRQRAGCGTRRVARAEAHSENGSGFGSLW